MFAVFDTDVLRFGAHAAKDFYSRDHVIAVEPVVEGIFATAKQNGAVAFFRKDAVEIIYPERDAAPSEECKRDK